MARFSSPSNTQDPPVVQAVLFDYGLVLTGPPDPTAWETMRRLLRMEEAAFHDAYWRPRHAYDRGDLHGAAYWTEVAGHALTDADTATLLDADTALWTQPNLPMVAWAARLQRAGIRTGILSNLGDAMEQGVLATLPWMRNFAHHTFSHRLGMTKPDLAIYTHAAAGLGVALQSVLFVDDREENIAGAARAGMLAVLYTTHADFVERMQQHGLADTLLLHGPDTAPARAHNGTV